MRTWRTGRHLVGATPLAALLVLITLASVAAAPRDGSAAPGRDRPAGPRTKVIVTLAVADPGSIDPATSRGRQRLRARADRTKAVTTSLEAEHGFRARQRFSAVLPGFSARLTAAQLAALERDPQVSDVRPVRRFRVAGQSVPVGIRRVKALPAAGTPDVDADIAIVDTGIGPVGGGELNVMGGMDCTVPEGDPRATWDDLYGGGGYHGTHVAGTAAARDNGLGVVGVAPGARLWAVRVFDSLGYGDEETVVCGLEWAVRTRGPGAPPGSQPVEVVNLSLQGPRPWNDIESCDGRPTDPGADPDLIHRAVCAAWRAGITVVAAAGNYGEDARNTSPAGYDQVITVGALTDFDGRPGSRSGSPSGCGAGSEADDTWASYGNHGPDVDILAPGTCVRSSTPSSSGGATRLLSGTSMATPHVTGAVARYLAGHPGADPEHVRRVLVAAGRLDWALLSDPDWSGPADRDPPRRLLDVAALGSDAGVRAWLHPDRLTAARDVTERVARVDVQRLGGYDGNVDLELSGLPGAAGDGTFRPGASLAGLTDIGARLELSLDPAAGDGLRTLRVRASGAGAMADVSPDLALLVDRSGPVVSGLRARLQGSRTALASGNAATLDLRWTSEDALSGGRKDALQRKVGTAAWKTVASGPGLRQANTTISPADRTRFRVRSIDSLGNATRSVPLELRLVVRDSVSLRIEPSTDGWRLKSSSKAVGGSLLVSRSTLSGLVTEFDGRGVGIVAPVGPTRGAFRVRIDGGTWTSVDLGADTARSRRVVHAVSVPPGRHRLEIDVREGTVAVDAFLILR